MSADVVVDAQSGFFSLQLKGHLWLDYAAKGAKLHLTGSNPLSPGTSLNLTGVVTPDLLHISANIWFVQTGNCSSVAKAVPVALFPPLAIPSTSEYLGESTVDGVQVEGWRVTVPFAGVPPIDVYVTTAAPHNIVQMKATVTKDGLEVAFSIVLSHMVNTVILPSVYAQPPACHL